MGKPLAPTANINVESIVPLVVPRALKNELAITEDSHRTVVTSREAISRILRQEDARFLVIVGPCSIHDVSVAMEYANRLAAVQREFNDRLCILMRVYFEKPRTTVGWKGFINDPHLDGSYDIQEGLRLARKILLDITALGVAGASEMLDPITPMYIDDLLSWAAIGARTTESQTHRQMASGLSMPVGFKNNTDGNIKVAADAMEAASRPHCFMGIDEEGRAGLVTTRGNPNTHIILRGGRRGPNYGTEHVEEALALLRKNGMREAVMVDCSHANSGKHHDAQEAVWRHVIELRASGTRGLIGAMLESNLNPGRQDLGTDRAMLRHGVSITDACIGWDKTVELLRFAYDKLE